MIWIIAVLYGLSLTYIFLFSLSQLHLTSHYLKSKKEKITPSEDPVEWPMVTIQLPVYNEKYVAKRLIDNIAKIDYPAGHLEIQVLDDSNDETTQIIHDAIRELGVDYIHQIRRDDRTGFKAGALQYGLNIAKGSFIAIFDSDFMPESDFLKKTIPLFERNTGVIQTRWGHLNADYSLLTRMQAFGLDAHFSIEQVGRSHAGSFINFNGTGGVWRKECIIDSGGWSADTLTEDLDLSYRAQLKGWKFKYLEDCIAPAELPVIMQSVKSQQYRWNKGAAETARKNLGKVLRSKLGFMNKVHAVFHLLNSSIFVGLLFAAVLSIPMLYIKDSFPEFNIMFNIGSFFILGFFSISIFYWVATKNTSQNKSFKYFLKTFPAFLVVSMGLTLHNAIAVIEGLIGKKTPFIRTPKFNSINKTGSWKKNSYIKRSISLVTFLEALFSLYFIFGIFSGIYLKDWGLMIFHVMLAVGFFTVFVQSIKPREYAR